MGQIVASSAAVRQLAQDLNSTIKNLEAISRQVKETGRVSNWEDSQSVQFQEIVKQISQLTSSPIATLQGAIPRLNKIADALDQYKKVQF